MLEKNQLLCCGDNCSPYVDTLCQPIWELSAIGLEC